MRLTDVGQRFFDDCRRILAELADAEAEAGGAFSSPQGQLAVTAPALFGRMHVAPVMLDFLAAHPGVTARCFLVDRIVNLHDEGYDVAVRIAQLPDSGLTAVKVGAVRRVVVASPEYLAAHVEPQVPADLAGHVGIGFSQSAGPNRPWSFDASGGRQRSEREPTTPRMQLASNASEVAIAAALRGRDVTRALSYQVADEVQASRLRIVLAGYEPAPAPVHLVFAAGRKVPAKLRAFIDFAVERLRREPVLWEDER